MKEQIKRIYHQQIGNFIALWAIPACMAFLFEADILPKGVYAANAQMDYILQSIGILLTIGLIPFSLRIFSLNLVKRVKELPLQNALKSYRIWADVRICLLFVPQFLLPDTQYHRFVLCCHGSDSIAFLCAIRKPYQKRA